MSLWGLVDTIKNARATLRDWGEYRRETGRWPLLSIAAHASNFVALAAIVLWLILYGSRHGWSNSHFGWTLIVALLPYMLLWSWVEDKVKLNEIRSRRRLRFAKRSPPLLREGNGVSKPAADRAE